MGKNLVIVESPAKAKTINKILGSGFVVKSSMGHVRDLPVKSLGVEIRSGFKPKYVVVRGRQKTIGELKQATKECDRVYLAPDPDREGEAIAWHLKALLEDRRDPAEFLRVRYNEITQQGVRHAFEHPAGIEINRVNAQQARRILDRIVGYMVSPMLWRRIGPGLSAGRVQSVALRLICEREREIEKFVPEVYWLVGARVRKKVPPLDPFRIRLVRIEDEKSDIRSEQQVAEIRQDLEGRTFRVTDVATRLVRKRPAPPYITSTLQQAASSYASLSPKRTMSVAQKLYEGIDLGEGPVGLITYMRTDSVNVSREAVEACRALIAETFGDEYRPEKPNFYRSRSTAQEAHEAIRPTDVRRTPEAIAGFLDPAQLKLYRLIWRRFVASQMSPARLEQRTVKIEAAPTEGRTRTYLFQATASEVKFPGYMAATGREQKASGKDNEEIDRLPELSEGEVLECLELLAERKETQPPPRYSETSLVATLEKNGVGRPSTFAQILSTLQERKYARREKRTLIPTELGRKVNDLLVGTLDDLFNVHFTAAMEEGLDEIEKGTVEWTEMLADFYRKFESWMARTKSPAADPQAVARVLEALQCVKEWAPEVKRGKRVFSDRRFVESVGRQLRKGDKEVSERQLATLHQIAGRYRDQAADIRSLLDQLGVDPGGDRPVAAPPRSSTVRKLEVLREVGMDDRAQSFVDSLRAQVEAGRSLSEAQMRALNNVVMRHAGRIENFEEVKPELEIGRSEVEEDHESGPMIQALASVSEWREPVRRGKRVFDDRAFYESLCDHFGRKGFLSQRQRAALRKMVTRYRDQIPGYEDLMRELGAGAGSAKEG